MVSVKDKERYKLTKQGLIMKKTLRNVTLGLALLSMLSLATVANAAIGDKNDKLKETVSNYSPDDWMLYAKSAQKLIRKKAHLGQTKEWITKSLVITAFFNPI